jgi:hypothetical protein
VQAGKLEGLASLSSKIDELADLVRSLKSRLDTAIRRQLRNRGRRRRKQPARTRSASYPPAGMNER